jgi:hypothetical protein
MQQVLAKLKPQPLAQGIVPQIVEEQFPPESSQVSRSSPTHPLLPDS